MVSNIASGSKKITIIYGVQPINILPHQAGTELETNATLSYDSATLPLESATHTVTVIEPSLALTQEVIAGSTGQFVGDLIRYRTTVENTAAQGTAYRVDLQSILPTTLLVGTSGVSSSP